MNFDIADNILQAGVMGVLSVCAAVLSYRRRDRALLILSFAYACFAMGTLYYVLFMAIRGDIPRVFYVSEISWIASYFFCLSLQIARSEGIPIRLRAVPFLCAVPTGALVFRERMMGPSWMVVGVFAVAMGMLMYMTVFRLQSGYAGRKLDICLLACLILQLLVYISSAYMKDFIHFNLYFAIDLLLTGNFAALLPIQLRTCGSTRQERVLEDLHDVY